MAFEKIVWMFCRAHLNCLIQNLLELLLIQSRRCDLRLAQLRNGECRWFILTHLILVCNDKRRFLCGIKCWRLILRLAIGWCKRLFLLSVLLAENYRLLSVLLAENYRLLS